MTVEQYAQIMSMASQVPALLVKYKSDGEEVAAFMDDFKDSLKGLTDEQYAALFEGILLIVLKGVKGVKNFKWYNTGSWDVTKEMRLACDNLARTMNFERYKKLRNLN